MRTVRQRLSPTGRRGPQVLVILENESACQSHRVCKQANTACRTSHPADDHDLLKDFCPALNRPEEIARRPDPRAGTVCR